MRMVRVSGSVGLASLWFSLICYVLSLILYLISFCLPSWIVYGTIPIKIGLWRLCDIQIIGYDRCADWSDRIYPSNASNSAFVGPPDFVRTSQSLEIVALVFYAVAGILLLIGICQTSMGLLFFASSMSMFVTVIFLSSTVGLFAGQGRSTYGGHLSFAWWIALIALILSLLTAVSLLVLSFFILPYPSNKNTVNPPIMVESSNGKVFYSSTPYGNQLSNDYVQ